MTMEGVHMKKLGLLAAAVVMLVAFTGCEPSMKITAAQISDSPGHAGCDDQLFISGQVMPASGTDRVYLQQTKNGKWVDVMWWGDSSHGPEEQPHLLSAAVDGGTFHNLTYHVETYTTKHFRVRSSGGTAFSNSFYVTIKGGPTGYCPGY